MSPEEKKKDAYAKFQEALSKGQAQLDALPDDVKEMAKKAAEDSLGSEDRFSSFEPIPGMTPGGYKGPADSFETTPISELKDPSAEGYRPVPGIAPPPEPGPSKEFMGREEYKGFRVPKELQGDPERLKAYKKAIDEREAGQSEREQGRIASASPQDQAADIIRRAAEGDPDALGDVGEVGLNIASMVGPQQVAADLSLAGIDASRGDYTGAAMGVAAAGLPFVSAGMMKQIMNKDFGEEARDLLINHGQIGYEIEQALVESKGVVTDAIKELQEYREYLGNNVMKAIQDADDIAPMDAAKLDSSLAKATGKSLDEVIDSAKRNQRGRQMNLDQILASGERIQRAPRLEDGFRTAREAIDAAIADATGVVRAADKIEAEGVKNTSSFIRNFVVEDKSAKNLLDLLPEDTYGDSAVYTEALEAADIGKVLSEMSDGNLTDAFRSISDGNIVVRRGPRDHLIFGQKYIDDYIESRPSISYDKAFDELDKQASRAIDDVFARNQSIKDAITRELTRRTDGDPEVARRFAKAISARRTKRRELENKYLAEMQLSGYRGD